MTRRGRFAAEIAGGIGDETDPRLGEIRATSRIGFVQARSRVIQP